MCNANVGLVERLCNALRYSLQGLTQAWRCEAAFRYEVYVLIFALPAAWVLGAGGVKRALLIGSALLVVVVEMINSAVEAVVDRIGPERHELSGRAKDLGSAAVFCAIVLALVVWLLLLID
jgi:diacylglycerol kinase (ATP)